VDDGDAAGNVRVGIAFAGHAVGCPAGVGDAGDGLVLAEAASSSATRPTERTRSMPSPLMTAKPAES
jgi:hypothetical protein